MAPEEKLLEALREFAMAQWIAGLIFAAAILLLLPYLWRSTVAGKAYALRDVGYLSDCIIGENCR